MLNIFYIIIFSIITGLLATWLDRKVTARVQFRQGPPWFQPFADILKLLGKETIVPEGSAASVFLGAPLFGLAAALLVAVILFGGVRFTGDLLVIFYLLTIPSTALIIGASASRNPLAAIGASREMKMILAYELPFILAIFTVVAKTGSLELAQNAGASLSLLLAFLVALLVIQAKLGFVPFDLAEADQELSSGVLLEYSGPALAIFKLTKAVLLFILPSFLISLFFGGIGNYFWFEYVGVLTLIILIKNTNPRLRIDHILRFFWGPVTVVAIVGFVLALFHL